MSKINVSIEWIEDSLELNLEPTESAIYEAVGKVLLDIKCPNQIDVDCGNYGYATFFVKKRGTFIKNGITRPSIYVTEDYNCIKGLAPSTYKEAYLTCINPESNNYKFYHLKPTLSNIKATYGRIGSERGEMFGVKDLENPYPTHMYWIRYYEKLSKGYTDQSDIYLNNTPTEVKDTVQDDDKTAPKKVNLFSQSLFDELKACARQYVATHCISTQVSVGQLEASIRFYDELFKLVESGCTIKAFNDKLMELLTVCPRKARYIDELLARTSKEYVDILDREENLINSMKVLVKNPNKPIKSTDCFELHNIRVFEATERQKEEVLRHLDDNLKSKVDTIYRVICKEQKGRFDTYLKKKGIKKVKQYWHGSKNENWLSIILNGLKLNPNAVITGKMFGDGIYFAPKSQKAWNYTSFRGSYWAKGSSDVAYMGLYATAYGIPEDVWCAGKYNQSILDARGKNCIHAHAGRQLLNDEIVFYHEDSICLNYIVKFK